MGEKAKFFLRGSVLVAVDGFAAERFLNIVVQRGLSVCNVSRSKEDGLLTFQTTVSDFRQMKPAARKAGVSLRIRGRAGLPFFLYRRRKRKLLGAGILFFFLFLYGMTFFIWDISFEGNHRFTDQTLLRFMKTLPVDYGMVKEKISCEELEAALRNEFTEITWVSAQITGTRLIIRIKENEGILSPKSPDTTPCDLVAERDGVVTRTVVRSGVPQVKAKDVVEAGTVLVSGTIPIYDDFDTLVNSHQVRADGEIYAETIHTFTKKIPTGAIRRARTGQTRFGVFINMLGRQFHFLAPGKGDSDWEYVTEQHQLKLFDDFYLPVYVTWVTAYEYVPYEHLYSREELSEFGERLLEEYYENFDKKGIQILGKDVKIEMSASGHVIRGTLKVTEDIATPAPISHQENPEENQAINERN